MGARVAVPEDEIQPEPAKRERLEDLTASRERVTALATVILPTLGFCAAVGLLWNRAISWTELLLCIAFYIATATGISAGFHRFFAHRSFESPFSIRLLLGILGSMAAQGPLLYWVAVHRKHHRHSDRAGDPHSPHHRGAGVLSLLHGFWNAHVGWMFNKNTAGLYRRVPDLLRDPVALAVNRYYVPIVVCGILLPGVITAMVERSVTGFFTGMLWGGLARIFLLHHATWGVNSICHLFGNAPFETGDRSRNNFVCAVIAVGEGWHNNHHAFPTSARHGLRWWQIDCGYWFICILGYLNLATNIRTPSDEQVARKLLAGTRRNGDQAKKKSALQASE